MGYALNCDLSKDMDGRTLFHRFRYHLGAGFVGALDVVADYGCGTGYGSEILSQHAVEVKAFDMEHSNIACALEKYFLPNITYSQENIEEIVLPEVDVACSFEVIEHLYKPKEFVEKLKKTVKKYIIVSVPLNQKLVMVDGDPQEEGDSTHHSVFTQQEFMELFVDEVWKPFYTFTQGVTFIAIFYNTQNI